MMALRIQNGEESSFSESESESEIVNEAEGLATYVSVRENAIRNIPLTKQYAKGNQII